jgi:hypothetical protein
VDGGETQSFDEIFDSARDNNLRGPSGETAGGPDDSSQGREVEVIHVGVGEEDEVDRGELSDRDSGMALAAQENQSFGEDRVDENFAPGDLEKEGGVTDEGDTEIVVADQLDGPGGS